MADDYLSISEIANDHFMTARMNAATTQQYRLGSIQIADTWGSDARAPIQWVEANRYLWASSPGWGAAWASALAGHLDQADYQPGRDGAVITDDMILSAVQTLAVEPATELA